jgi:hypothetical protein
MNRLDRSEDTADTIAGGSNILPTSKSIGDVCLVEVVNHDAALESGGKSATEAQLKEEETLLRTRLDSQRTTMQLVLSAGTVLACSFLLVVSRLSSGIVHIFSTKDSFGKHRASFVITVIC